MSDSLIRNQEIRMKEAKSMNLMNDTFLTVAFRDILACQYVLRKLTGIDDLIVKEVRTQHRVAKLTSHDAILDVLAEDSKGRIYNIEIQREDTVDHARRTRFYGAMIDGEFLQKGKKYEDMPELRIIYISETDIWGQGQCVYPVKKILGTSEQIYKDGIDMIYINAEVDDGSEIAELMRYFVVTDPNDMRHGDLSKRVHYLKCEEGGMKSMCEITDRWLQDGIEIGIEQGREQGREEGILLEKQAIARKLVEEGMALRVIARVVDTDKKAVKQWLGRDYSYRKVLLNRWKRRLEE